MASQFGPLFDRKKGVGDQRSETPGRRDEDVTMAEVVAELRNMNQAMVTMQGDMSTMREILVAWNNAKVFGKVIVGIGKVAAWLVGFVLAIAALMAMVKSGMLTFLGLK